MLHALTLDYQLDHGLEVITEHIAKTDFPWLMSNVIDNETGRPLGSGKSTHVIQHGGIKVGIMGLVEKEWLDTLPTIDPKEVTYTDFIKIGNKLAMQLRNEVNCNVRVLSWPILHVYLSNCRAVTW